MLVELITDMKYESKRHKAGELIDIDLPLLEIKELVKSGAIKQIVPIGQEALPDVDLESTRHNPTEKVYLKKFLDLAKAKAKVRQTEKALVESGDQVKKEYLETIEKELPVFDQATLQLGGDPNTNKTTLLKTISERKLFPRDRWVFAECVSIMVKADGMTEPDATRYLEKLIAEIKIKIADDYLAKLINKE